MALGLITAAFAYLVGTVQTDIKSALSFASLSRSGLSSPKLASAPLVSMSATYAESSSQFAYLSKSASRCNTLAVFVETPTGVRGIPVYNDAPDFEDVSVVVEDQDRRKIVN